MIDKLSILYLTFLSGFRGSIRRSLKKFQESRSVRIWGQTKFTTGSDCYFYEINDGFFSFCYLDNKLPDGRQRSCNSANSMHFQLLLFSSFLCRNSKYRVISFIRFLSLSTVLHATFVPMSGQQNWPGERKCRRSFLRAEEIRRYVWVLRWTCNR